MTGRRIASIGFLLASILVTRAAAADCTEPISGTEFGLRSTPGKSIASMPRVEESTARYLRLRLKLATSTPNGWYLVLRDKARRSAQVLRPEDFQPSGNIWTKRIRTSLVTFDAFPGNQVPDIQIVEYISMPKEGLNTYYSEVNPDSKPVPLFELGSESARRLGDGVGMVMSTFDDRSWCCTGVAVARDLLLTNWHCGGAAPLEARHYWNPDVCSRTLIDFSWDGDDESQEYQCSKVEAASEARDYALLRIAPLAGSGPIRPAQLDLSETATGRLRLIHHMACSVKQVSESCSVLDADVPGRVPGSGDVRMLHDCTSNPGSSGGPLFNGAGDVIGLHHDGVTRDPQTCQPTDSFNKAIRIGKIVEDIAGKSEELKRDIHP